MRFEISDRFKLTSIGRMFWYLDPLVQGQETTEVGAAVGALVMHIHAAVNAAWDEAAAKEASKIIMILLLYFN